MTCGISRHSFSCLILRTSSVRVCLCASVMCVETCAVRMPGSSRVRVSVVRSPESSWKRVESRVRGLSGHLGLILLLLVYTAGGAKIFQDIELPREIADFERIYSGVMQQRQHLMLTAHNSINVTHVFRSLLEDYERQLLSAMRAGIDIVPGQTNYTYKWDYIHSLFFSSTVLTTIGYGHMAPRTTPGRMFCMLFALVGIPLTVTVISDLGSVFASTCTAVYERLCLRADPAGQQVTSADSSGQQVTPGVSTGQRRRLSDRASRAFTVLLSLALLLLYIAVGGMLFLLWENWTFLESFYFCFITMTTIGFGDFVPKNARYMLVCTVYILVGLALTTTIIELVRRQYAQSWQQVKMLSSRLQSLSGPLAVHLRRLGEHGGHAVTLDVDLLRELKELRRTMVNNKLPHQFALNDDELDALNPPRPLLQIVFYESNV